MSKFDIFLHVCLFISVMLRIFMFFYSKYSRIILHRYPSNIAPVPLKQRS